MKNVWFYGCSLTAGDELSDEEFFPWKKDCKTVKEYHDKRRDTMTDNPDLDARYQTRNKELSYPSKIKNELFDVFNRAENGASVKSMIVKSMKDIMDVNKIDFIVFQIPPGDREMYLRSDHVSTIQMAFSELSKYVVEYRKVKMHSHKEYQSPFEDFIDLILYDSYLNNKSIPHLFLFLNEIEYTSRSSLLKNNYFFNYSLKEFLKLPQMIVDIPDRTLAGHLTKEAHIKVAKIIKHYIQTHYESLS